MTDPRLLLLSPQDNILVAREPIPAGETILVEDSHVTLAARLDRGHKIARDAIGIGEKIFKYGAPIGSATQPIAAGESVHIHNIKSDYTATHVIAKPATEANL
ncbi:UxaA family hydrolase [Devosia naphthalenivorans]|uniref:UxaA family hydrolase n=1 Tax=Devosia naphthalenivorans TaxID=2082392 RepID=UPI000D3CC7E9|nr:UxaA family hydrolase [Devosia naphthalenivorans]